MEGGFIPKRSRSISATGGEMRGNLGGITILKVVAGSIALRFPVHWRCPVGHSGCVY